MCVMSVVHDYFSQRPINIWTQNDFDYFKQIMDKLNELDERLGEPDCEDPSKASWMREVEDRLARLESAG